MPLKGALGVWISLYSPSQRCCSGSVIRGPRFGPHGKFRLCDISSTILASMSPPESSIWAFTVSSSVSCFTQRSSSMSWSTALHASQSWHRKCCDPALNKPFRDPEHHQIKVIRPVIVVHKRYGLISYVHQQLKSDGLQRLKPNSLSRSLARALSLSLSTCVCQDHPKYLQ